jgi:hypothetical protein
MRKPVQRQDAVPPHFFKKDRDLSAITLWDDPFAGLPSTTRRLFQML